MRSGGCAVQQALTSEAAGMVKQAVVVAKRRGHAQVTPLHVANSMLAAAGGALRSACQQSHSHPLQCKALELCFNVALNRLPATANPIHYPSISNALVAAFKRAQAHQRRGAADTQQQQQAAALLAVKIELEQLIISILDDPSVSRVMREAGFSSTQVKNNVEKSISLELRPQPRRRSRSRSNEIPNKVVILDPDNEDSDMIIETLVMSKRNRNMVVVGESVSNVEKAVRRLMERVEGGQVPEALSGLKFVSIPPFYTFCNVRRELVQQKIQELGFLAKSLVGEGVVLYLGDLNWISEYRVSNVERGRSSYCSVEHMIMELGRLVSSLGSGGRRIWLLGIATFQTFMRCRNGYDSLENIWRLHPLTIPANTLGLSLLPHSHSTGNEAGIGLDCSSSEFGGEEAQNLQIGATLLPCWLKDESKRLSNYNDQEASNNRQPKSIEKTLTLSCASPSSSTSCFSSDQRNPNLQKFHLSPSSNPCSAGKFKEFNAQNLNILCNALEEKVPWQREIIPEIAGTILQCRSGMLRRKSQGNVDAKEETWLFFLGPDARAKKEIARNLAECVFGSYSKLVCLSSRGEGLAAAVSENPHRVFLVEDFELADRSWRRRIKGAIERGRVRAENGEEFGLCDAIVVLSCERFGSVRNVEEEEEEEDVSLDLNMCLRGHDDLAILQNVDSLLLF